MLSSSVMLSLRKGYPGKLWRYVCSQPHKMQAIRLYRRQVNSASFTRNMAKLWMQIWPRSINAVAECATSK